MPSPLNDVNKFREAFDETVPSDEERDSSMCNCGGWATRSVRGVLVCRDCANIYEDARWKDRVEEGLL